MTIHRNYIVSVSGVVVLLGLSVFGLSPATPRSDARPIGPVKPAAVLQTSGGRAAPTRGFVAATSVAASSIPNALLSDRNDDLSIDATLGDENIALERKRRRRPGSCCQVVISIIAVLVGRPAGDGTPPMIDLRATITGEDAVRGSLIYALAWLAGDADPLAHVRALGFNIDASVEHDRPCTDRLAGGACLERARRLATLLDATLALGDPDERLLFRQSAGALGVAPDCSAPVTRALVSEEFNRRDLLIDATLGDREVTVRKAGRDRTEYLVVKMNDVLLTSGDGEPPQSIDLRATIEGADAGRGSLPYALAWLAGYADPQSPVHALGYDLTVRNQRIHSCSNRQGGYTCENAARRLATLIDATLALGVADERSQFRRDAAAIGIAPDCVP